MMETSLAVVPLGTLNQLLHYVGKSGKIETMMKLFYKTVALGGEVNFSTYSILLKNLLAHGNWRKYVEVMQWMVEGGIYPSMRMYHDILSFAQKSAGSEYGTMLREWIESIRKKSENKVSLKKLSESSVPTNALIGGEFEGRNLAAAVAAERGVL